jgi:hypothetical protein
VQVSLTVGLSFAPPRLSFLFFLTSVFRNNDLLFPYVSCQVPFIFKFGN